MGEGIPSSDSVPCRRRRRKHVVTSNQVVVTMQEYQRVSKPIRYPAQYRPYPRDADGHARPRKPQRRSRRQHCGEADDGDTCFWRPLPGLRVDLVQVVDVQVEGVEGDGEDCTNADAAEGETADAGAPPADFGEDDRVGNEAEVEDAVYHSDINGPENTIERVSSKPEGTNDETMRGERIYTTEVQ